MTNFLIKNGHITDPSQGIDAVGCVLITDGRVEKYLSEQIQSRSMILL